MFLLQITGVLLVSFKKKIKSFNHAVQKIAEPHSKLHLLTTDALAEKFGFGNSKSVSSTFKVMAGMSVADFIKLSKKNYRGLN